MYSDSEEPHQWYNREEYPQVTKKTKQSGEPRTVTIIQPVPVASTSTAQDSGALKKIATLVQKQKETLEGAGVSLPGPDKGLPAAVTVRTAVPQKKIAALKKGDLKCPVCKKIFKQASKCKSHYETNHSYQSKHFCETCQSPFSSQGALDRHKVMHEKFACHWPGHNCQSFDTYDALKAHLSNEEQFVNWNVNFLCKFCLRHFTRRDSTRKHQVKCIHNPDRKIVYSFCKHCGSRFNEKKHKNNHERKCKVDKGVPRQSRRAAANKARAKGTKKK